MLDKQVKPVRRLSIAVDGNYVPPAELIVDMDVPGL